MESFIESELDEFIKRLPNLGSSPPEAHLLMVALRSRLTKALIGMPIKDIVVERKIIRPAPNWRENYKQKVINLVLLQTKGTYVVKKNDKDITVPNGACAIFGTVSPRNVRKASSELMKLVFDDAFGPGDVLPRIDVKFFSMLHAHRSTESPRLLTVDIDNATLFKDVRDRLSPFKVWMITKTSRGYHIILDMTNAPNAKDFWEGGGIWSQIHALYPTEIELQRDPQEPIPGTLYTKPDSTEPNYVRIIE